MSDVGSPTFAHETTPKTDTSLTNGNALDSEDDNYMDVAADIMETDDFETEMVENTMMDSEDINGASFEDILSTGEPPVKKKKKSSSSSKVNSNPDILRF